MRLFAAAAVVGALGCCLGPTPAPQPAPVPATSPLSQALEGMGAPSGGAVPPVAPPVAEVPTPVAATPTSAATPACAEARAAKKAVSVRLTELRMTLGAQSGARLEQAGQALVACNSDMACVRDAQVRTARIEAYDRAKSAHEAETRRLAEAEVGLYDANRAVVAACGS